MHNSAPGDLCTVCQTAATTIDQEDLSVAIRLHTKPEADPPSVCARVGFRFARKWCECRRIGTKTQMAASKRCTLVLYRCSVLQVKVRARFESTQSIDKVHPGDCRRRLHLH